MLDSFGRRGRGLEPLEEAQNGSLPLPLWRTMAALSGGATVGRSVSCLIRWPGCFPIELIHAALFSLLFASAALACQVAALTGNGYQLLLPY